MAAETKRVASTCLSFVAYDWDRETLRVTFSGSRASYVYFGVPSYVYLGLLQAPSKGRFYNAAIRDRYTYSKG